MQRKLSYSLVVGCGLAALLGGCPTDGLPLEFVAGGTGDVRRVGDVASLRVLAPLADISIRGGTSVEVVWSAIATTNFSSVSVIFDVDQDPTNDNEIIAIEDLSIDVTSTLLDTTDLSAQTYFIGVLLFEQNSLSLSAYAPGTVTVNQRTDFFFESPRENVRIDRSQLVTPRFDVKWQLLDPDSTVTVQIFLDPDQQPNGNEFLLFESTSQTGDEFTFDLPTALFEPGTYRILALISDGVGQRSIYAPAFVQIRSRIAAVIDLRDIELPGSPIAGAVFQGFNPRDNLGSFVGGGVDLDRDGFTDPIMMSQFGKPQYVFNTQRTGVGEAYVVYGRGQRYSGKINVNSIGALVRGEIFTGVPEATDPIRPSRGITSFTHLGDWDNDGVREFAFGLPFTDSLTVVGLDAGGYFRSGAVIVVAGSVLAPDLGFPGANPANVTSLADIGTLPHEPLQPTACPEGFVGGKPPFGTGSGAFTTYHRHIFDAGGAPLGGRTLGCRISTADFGDQCGERIAAIDFDGLMITIPNANPGVTTFGGPDIEGAGVVVVYYPPTFLGFYPWSNVNSPAANDAVGYPGTPQTVDVNLLPHGGPYHYTILDPRGYNGFPGSPGYIVDVDDSDPCIFTFAAGCPWWGQSLAMWGQFEGGRLAHAASLGDFDEDGIGDFLIGSPLSNEGAGACYIVFGRLRNLVVGSELPVEELALPLNADEPSRQRIFDGIRVIGNPGDRLGEAQTRAGDFNGDGLPDALIGAPLANARRGGATVLFGSVSLINLTEDELLINDIPTRDLGVTFVGIDEEDLAGARVASAGDVDADGLDDILIAAPGRDVRLDVDEDGVLEIDREDCGVVYLIYGSPDLRGTISLAQIGTEALPGAVFIGARSGDNLGAGIGLQGDRSFGIAGAGDVDGDGRTDLLISTVNGAPFDRVQAGEVYLIYGEGD